MYLTPYQKKQLTTVILLVLGIPLTLFAIYQGVRWFTSAGVDTQPHDVLVSNVTTNSITISWTTESDTTGSIIPILNGNDQNPVIDKRGNSKYKTHYVELKSLEPNQQYSFKIVSGSDVYTGEDNQEFKFTTAQITTDTPTPNPIHGEISGNNVMIYVATQDKSTYPVSAVASDNGNWLIDLSALRKISDYSLYEIQQSTQLLLVAVDGVGRSAIAQGEYDTLFDSSGKLTESIAIGDNEYYTNFSDSSKLVAQEEVEEPEPTDDPVVDDDPIVEDPVEEDTTEYVINNDLEWVDMVSSDGTTVGEPQSYGEDTVMITNLTDVSFTVIWYSQIEEVGYVMYGENESSLQDKGKDERDGISTQGEYFLHSIEVTQLSPQTEYYFKVYSGDEVYSETFSVTTFETESSPPAFETVAGTYDISDYESGIVIAKFVDTDSSGSTGESYPISTLVDSEGSWILTVGGVRDTDGNYFNKNDNDNMIFTPKYFQDPPSTTLTIGAAMNDDVELSATDTATISYVKIPLLSDYGIL